MKLSEINHVEYLAKFLTPNKQSIILNHEDNGHEDILAPADKTKDTSG